MFTQCRFANSVSHQRQIEIDMRWKERQKARDTGDNGKRATGQRGRSFWTSFADLHNKIAERERGEREREVRERGERNTGKRGRKTQRGRENEREADEKNRPTSLA